MTFKIIGSEEIKKSLTSATRQYLVGHLERPQELKHLDSGELEIGITSYKKITEEEPHWHKFANEYQLVLQGETSYCDLTNGEVINLRCGDFYLIESGTCYSQESEAGTIILFIKVPSINDKMKCRDCLRDCSARIS